MGLLVVLLILLLIAIPVLAILAFLRVQQLGEQVDGARLRELVARVYSLEQWIAGFEKATQPEAVPSPPLLSSPPPIQSPTAAPSPQRASSVTPGGAAQPPPKPHDAAPAISFDTMNALPSVKGSRGKASSSGDLETLIAGRWLNRVGILAVIMAVSFFLKYAFDNDWIGPTGRIAVGVVLGAAMLPWSQWLLGKGYSYFSEGIAALGQATMLLSIWAGCRYYTLFSNDVGFAGMIAVTVVMAAVALGRNSERIALLSLVGGFLTPMLLSPGRNEEFALFTYLLVLGLGLLIIAARRDWRSPAPISFVFTQIYFWGWYETYYRSGALERTVMFATLFFLLYLALPVFRVIRTSSVDSIGVFVVLANSFAYLVALYVTLWPEYRWPLTLLVLALSVGHVSVAWFVPTPKPGEWPLARQLFVSLALTFATLAIPIRLDGEWITLALAVEGAILVWTGFRSVVSLLRGAGFLLLALAALRVVLLTLPAPHFLFNERFGAYAAVIACMGVALFAARQYGRSLGEGETAVLGIVAVAINVYALLALSLELWDYFGHTVSVGIDRGLAQHLALSLLWTAYASALIVTGIQRQSSLLRWQALVLFGLVVAKVFLYDSSYLERFYRIISFFALGLVLLVVSFRYQSKISRERSSS